LRTLVRDVAGMENISQNELIEQAIEHEVIARGALMADDLAQAAERLRRATQREHEALVERSIADFARGERQPDPLRSSRVGDDDQPRASSGSMDAVEAFRGVDA
jgi:hypothetical protein